MIATHMAQLMDSSKTILIDVFAGVGGNTIAFAKSGRWDHVYAIEKDADTIRCGIHNSEVYGVSKKISWLKGDCFEVIKNRLASLASKAVIFASPPWGGKFVVPPEASSKANKPSRSFVPGESGFQSHHHAAVHLGRSSRRLPRVHKGFRALLTPNVQPPSTRPLQERAVQYSSSEILD